MSASWTLDAMAELRRNHLSKEGADGWGYQPNVAASSEPSALATIAFALPSVAPEAASTADWLARIQLADGSVGISQARAEPKWPTALALLAWAAVGGHEDNRARAVKWLLENEGARYPRPAEDPQAHDSMLAGWPWVLHTHSWIEPTALAVLALRKEKRADHPRVREAISLVRDRSLPNVGGWNYGNTIVFHHELRPQPAPTGLALLALAGTQPADDMIDRGCAYLEKLLPTVRAPMSLAWGVLGLAAWSRRPAKADAWLAESFEGARTRDSFNLHAALLLLAGGERPAILIGDEK
jgi:hypothetical protein